jgi:hypothetical protein
MSEGYNLILFYYDLIFVSTGSEQSAIQPFASNNAEIGTVDVSRAHLTALQFLNKFLRPLGGNGKSPTRDLGNVSLDCCF